MSEAVSEFPRNARRYNPGHTGASGKVADYFLGNVGRSITLSELEKETGLPTDTVRNSISYLTRQKGYRIKTEVAGRRWRLTNETPGAPNDKSDDRKLYQELAKTRNGTVIVECEDGSIYKLVEI